MSLERASMTDFIATTLKELERRDMSQYQLAAILTERYQMHDSHLYAMLRGQRKGNRDHWQAIFDVLELEIVATVKVSDSDS